MKKFNLMPRQNWILLFVLWANILPAQLPSINIYTLENQVVNASTINNDSMPMVVVFFKTNDQKCCQQLMSISEKYESILSEKGVKLVGICIDCIGRVDHIKPFVYGHDLQIDVYVDKNGDLRRSMGIVPFPYTILYDENSEVICKYAGYCMNSDDLIEDKITECLKKMDNLDR